MRFVDLIERDAYGRPRLVRMRVLTPGEARDEAVIKQIKDIQRQTRERDVDHMRRVLGRR